MASSLSVKTVRPAPDCTPPGQLVLLHGWGANADDLLGIAPLLELPQWLMCCPDGPMQHPHRDDGRMWYDLETPQWTGLGESRSLVMDWLQALEQSTGVPLERTILVGFSQGAAMALDIGLQVPVAAVVMLSGYLHPELTVNQDRLPPVLVIHGREDQVVPLAAAQDTQAFLGQIQAPYTYQELTMGHEINLTAIALTRNFIQERLAAWDSP